MEDYHNGTTPAPSPVKRALLEQVIHETRKPESCSIETQTEDEDLYDSDSYYSDNFGFTTISEESPEQLVEANRESPETVVVVIETSSQSVQTVPEEKTVLRNSLESFPVLSENLVENAELNVTEEFSEDNSEEYTITIVSQIIGETSSESIESLPEAIRINTTPDFDSITPEVRSKTPESNSINTKKPVLGEPTEIDGEFFCETDYDVENGDLSTMSREEFEMIEQVCAELDNKNTNTNPSTMDIKVASNNSSEAKVVNGGKMADERNHHIVNNNNDTNNTHESITNGDTNNSKVKLENGGCEVDSVELKVENKSEEKTPKNGEMNGNYAESNSDSVSTISEVSSEDSLSPTKPKMKSGLPVPSRIPAPVKSELPKPAQKIEEVANERQREVKRCKPENGITKKHSFKTAATEIVHYCAATKQPPVERRRSSSVESGPLRKRSSSVVDVRMASTIPQDLPVRDNAASRKRMSALRTEPEPEPDYLTPLQRKDAIIKELKGQLADAQRLSDQRASAIEVDMDGQRFAYEEQILEKDDLITKLDQTLRDLDESHQNVMAERVELHVQLEGLTKEHEGLKEEMERREKLHQDRYLEMYNKGRDSARFERRDELEALARSGTEEVSVAELLEKVKLTEQELEWWQSARRDELYHETALPETSADATLRFLRDSMFHYLMKGPDADQHMQAIISIFKFTDTQLKNIKKAEKKKRKSTS